MSEIPDRSTWPADLATTNPALYRNITPDDRQHVSEATCWCGPRQVGNVGAWEHQ